MIKKISALLALTLLLSVMLCGCDTGKILSLLSIDLSENDPATVFAADILGVTEKSKDNVSGDFTYTILYDGTASVTAYSGSEKKLKIPTELDGHEVVALDNKALYGNETLTELVLPDSLRVVGNYAVMYCTELVSVTFGKGIEHIGVSAFEAKSINSSTGGGKLEKLVWNGSPKKISEKAFYCCDKLTEICLPQGVEIIEEWAFAKCFSTSKIILPDTLKKLGDHAFLKCRSAKEVIIFGSCVEIETSAFYQCRSLEKLTLGEGIRVLKKGTFEECSSLKSVVLPKSLEKMEKYVFYNCIALENVTAYSGITQTDSDIFDGDTLLTVMAPENSTIYRYATDNGIAVTCLAE